MRIRKIKIQNYRTIENIEIQFDSYYTAISGKNDSGKSNVVNSIRALMKEDSPFIFDEASFSIKDDYPKWKDEIKKQIKLCVEFEINDGQDAGLYNFLITYLKLELDSNSIIIFQVEIIVTPESKEPNVIVRINDSEFLDIKAQEVLKKLQASRTFLFHNSTDAESHYQFRYSRGLLKDLSEENLQTVEGLIEKVNKGIKKIANVQQKEITNLLGRLESKYKVGLSIPQFDLSTMPVNIELGDSKIEVQLDDWGSGTKNRTLILLTLLRAKQISTSVASASKITPIIVIEEPESFLHPSAQAEFGRVLQDLAEEFKIHVIVTTHSPYFLSINKPESNILLERKIIRKQLRWTQLIDTKHKNWMEPFGIALGLDNELFLPWKNILFNQNENVLLVEGDTDKQYFELLRSPEHGKNRLSFKGEILPYNGKDNLKNNVLLKFIMNKYRKVFITFDLDAINSVEDHLISLGLKRNKDYCPVGLKQTGQQNIEGLVPKNILTSVYSEHTELVQQAMNGSTKEKNSAKNKLKKEILEEFKKVAQPTKEFFGEFYKLKLIIDKNLS